MERKRIDEKNRRRPSGAAVMRDEVTDSLLRAFLEEWAVHGYAALSLERVAARAGAGKAAIYRRWPSKLALAVDAVQKFGMVLTDVADKGALRNDLEAYLLMLRRALRHRLVRKILPDLYAEASRGSELAPVLKDLSVSRRRGGVSLIERAIGRGELPAVIDRELAMDMIPASLYWGMIVTRRRITRVQIQRQVDALVAGLQAI
ncbi:TetR family transcriptional regulator [Rhizobium sp. Root73]|uniref:TetR-like C-terminal domain-containing protein n=1 Tax=unclassified Rhizobium TaxID=2613769 RepID=UPI00072B485F|nr:MULTISPECIES: TetR-like C-terminal domain-containing protein [unclassified Rhizobium]KQY15676.1 TetR family transcriptional regulator [Rhizobium sp. Root1334]KRC08764.1 TetR family transcriptional regulator [Rhizobium sp. Root73]